MMKHVFSKKTLGMAVILVSMGFTLSPLGLGLDHFHHDTLFTIRGKVQPPAEIIIVAIDEPSFALLEMQWPWPRGTHAGLIDQLFMAGAQVVVFDVLFSEPSLPQEDYRLSEILRKYPNTVLAMVLEHQESLGYQRESRVRPHPALVHPHTLLGFTNIPVDPDGFIRRPMLTQNNLQSLSFRAGTLFSPRASHPPKGSMINYYGPAGTMKTVSYYQAVELKNHFPDRFFQNKLVFVGFITKTKAQLMDKVTDHYPIPFSRWGGDQMAGVEIHAAIAGNLIQNRFIKPLPRIPMIIAAALLSVVSMLFFFRIPPVAGAGVLALELCLLWISSWVLFTHGHIYLPVQHAMVPLSASFLISPCIHYTRMLREKLFIRKAFSTYVAPAVVRQILKEPKSLVLGGEEREITAFFSDIAGFTAISEKLTPVALVSLLNEFLTEMTDIILAHSGTLDKFEGDAIIALWGAPVAVENHGTLACEAAVRMQLRLAELRDHWKMTGSPELHMRIGMYSGKAVVGNMGSKNRMDYTMMGDTVNTAARLEAVNKIYGTRSLIGHPTRHGLPDRFLTREIDAVRVVGKARPVTIYELMGFKKEKDKSWIMATADYEEGLHAYRRREWVRAIGFFERVITVLPGDPPSLFMVKRCREMKNNPPTEKWDGVTTLHLK